MDLVHKVLRFVTDPSYSGRWIAVLFLAEIVLNVIIVLKVNYTEIDWIAYMQEVKGVIDGDFNYLNLKGDTGPLVYPGGFVWIYMFLYYLTDQGKNIFLGQCIFIGIYMINLVVVFMLYRSAHKFPPYVYIMLCLSKRVHSIFVLRLFNDVIAMLFLYVAMLLGIRNRWNYSCLFYSLGLSVKMNVLLFLPGLGVLLLKRFGFWRTFPKVFIIIAVQILVAVPFLTEFWFEYLSRAFEFGREFKYKWTVNWKMLDEHSVFLNKSFALGLLITHFSVLLWLVFTNWTRMDGGLFKILFSPGQYQIEKQAKSIEKAQNPKDNNKKIGQANQGIEWYRNFEICYIMFTSNFVGIVFARSLHFQFYSWYFHSLPFLLYITNWPIWTQVAIFAAIEIVWNIYPANAISSSVLLFAHLCLLLSILINRNVLQKENKKD